MERQTATLTVIVNLDMVPGTMHTPESANEVVQSILNEMIGHYSPLVTLNPVPLCGHKFYMSTHYGLACCGESTCNNYIH